MTESWLRARAVYKKLEAELKVRYPSWYFMMHTETFRYSLGDPTKDNDWGWSDAMKNHRQEHGILYGEFFGTSIGGYKWQ